GSEDLALDAIDADLSRALLQEDTQRTRALLTLRKAAPIFAWSQGKNRETAFMLFKNPGWLTRFVHNVDAGDDPNRSLEVLQALYEHDPRAFKEKFEFCLAYSVVWDAFPGHPWIPNCGQPEEDGLLKNYSFYLNNEKKMAIRPGTLPCELNVFVVATGLTREERAWVLRQYDARTLIPSVLYDSVPWTFMNEVTLSPAHGKGLDLAYTLENIKKIGGCCMDQAYFTENIVRLFGIPAVFAVDGGHAFCGVFKKDADPGKAWDFDVGRFFNLPFFTGRLVKDSRIYYQGMVADPTDLRNVMTEGDVRLIGAFYQEAGSIEKMEESDLYIESACWIDDRECKGELTDELEAGKWRELHQDLLQKALTLNGYNRDAWQHLSRTASEIGMTEKETWYWIQKAEELLLHDYPGFYLSLLEGLAPDINSQARRDAIFEAVRKTLGQEHPHLSCYLKAVEGKVWLRRGELEKGIACFLFPLEEYEKNDRILSTALLHLESIDPFLLTEQEIIDAHKMIFRCLSKMDRKNSLIEGAQKRSAASLFKSYTQLGQIEKANQYKKYL
ncbi:MAG: hypothetical protein ABIK28_15980, partial [Planctomycetota bacterium]